MNIQERAVIELEKKCGNLEKALGSKNKDAEGLLVEIQKRDKFITDLNQ